MFEGSKKTPARKARQCRMDECQWKQQGMEHVMRQEEEPELRSGNIITLIMETTERGVIR
eukprot:1156519-Pelagomonas_calceolata.AAC.2